MSHGGRTYDPLAVGGVARPQDEAGFRLARFQISCCAADAVAAVVRVIDGAHEIARVDLPRSYRSPAGDLARTIQPTQDR
ncbi:MAG: hypothetical protein ACRDS0_10425 [Pseudonocardiaceae bacterium]